jgi:hypothetical protein
MPLRTEPYRVQAARWPNAGRHILAHYDAATVVYQAYAPSIGRFAAEHGWFGGPFSYERMSWIKPNFLWMMYRSGWGAKQGQEITLAVHLRRDAFDAILGEAVHSAHVPAVYESEVAWKARAARSQVRLQWDPDHGPSGGKLERRAGPVGAGRRAHFSASWNRASSANSGILRFTTGRIARPSRNVTVRAGLMTTPSALFDGPSGGSPSAAGIVVSKPSGKAAASA